MSLALDNVKLIKNQMFKTELNQLKLTKAILDNKTL